ncbi:hypothetical protein ES703_101314 [subsurface metagenome]
MPKELKYTDIGSIKISDTAELKAKIVDDEYVDFRIWVKTENYTGPTKRGIRFYLFDSNFEEFCKLVEKVKKVYEDLA